MSPPSLDPSHWFTQGTRLLTEGQHPAAVDAFQHALSLSPDSAEVHANLALTLERMGAMEAAESHYRQALTLAPRQTEIARNFGALLLDQKRFAEAEAVYRDALSLDPDAVGIWCNLGVLLASIQREEEAEHCYRTALTLAPTHRKTAFNLAYLLLRQGRYEEGWMRLDARDWTPSLDQALGCPRWHGEPLAGKSLFIGIEGGLGDMIQFSRYAPLLKAQGAARIGLLCQPVLKDIFASLKAIDVLISLDDPAPPEPWDYWAAPMSLPRWLSTQPDTIPAALPYLAPPDERVAYWCTRLSQHEKTPRPKRVGLVWKGNPGFENDADRSLPGLATLASLANIPGIRYISLQKGAEEETISHHDFPGPLEALGAELKDFADTAAIVAQLDLVITVDTAVAHLAGALGRPCWVLLPAYRCDWRWLKAREDSPWYPDILRLFRQTQPGDWESVIASVRTALQTYAAL